VISVLLYGSGFNGVGAGVTSADMTSNIMYEELSKYNDLSIKVLRAGNEITDEYVSDFLLFMGYSTWWAKLDKELLRKRGFKKIVSLVEVGYIEADWSFCFMKNITSNFNFYYTPYYPKVYSISEKERYSFLIDHYWENYLETGLDKTKEIQSWIKYLPQKFKFYRLTRFENEIATLTEREIHIPYTNFSKYLELTDNIETLIMTHHECYPFGVMDMVARGTRVIAPKGFLPKEDMVDYLGIQEFSNSTEFYDLVNTPPDTNYLRNLTAKLTPYERIVEDIYKYFKDN
jgi:hypothetical protein